MIEVPFESITHLELTTRIDGFADTRLAWRPDRGEGVPLFYTVRLTQPVAIGGVVHDPEGRPVIGAKVGFNHQDQTASSSRPESHEFGWIQVETNEQGRWRINRISEEMIPRLYGSARHPEYVGSPFAFVSRVPEIENQLRSETHVFELKPGMAVHGTVVGPDGAAIAEAKVLMGQRGSSDSRMTLTGVDGTFSLTGCSPGDNLVTGEAPGFAPSTTRVEVIEEMPPIQITLQRAKILLLRVEDEIGRPVQHANVWLNTHSRGPVMNPSDPHPPRLQAEFHEKTNREGKVVWHEAPDADLSFDIHGRSS